MPGPWYYEQMRGLTGIFFVGCVHTVTPELIGRLNRVLEYADAFEYFALVFGGDLSSSLLLDRMKVEFYEAKRDEPMAINRFVKIVDEAGGFARGDTAENWLTTVQREAYIGPWIGKYASEKTRKAIEQGFIDNTEAICQMAEKFRARGARVLVCGGNWEDVQNTRDTLGIPEVPDHIPMLRDMGVEVFTEIEHVHVGNFDLVFLPFWDLKRFNDAAQQRLDKAIHACNQKYTNLRIAIAHAEPNWAVHNKMNPTIPEDRAGVVENLGTCLARLMPRQVVYPHQHDPIKTAEGHVMGDNVKYLLRVKDEGVELVQDSRKVGPDWDDIIVASYIPFQKVGLLNSRGPGGAEIIEVLSI